MATLLERYDTQYGHSLLRQRVQVAIESAAYDVINEDVATPNHDNRLHWSSVAINDPPKMMDIEMALVAQNATISEQNDEATDNDIQYIVNGLVDPVANALASGAIKP